MQRGQVSFENKFVSLSLVVVSELTLKFIAEYNTFHMWL